MTAPRPREHNRPASPPDRLPPRPEGRARPALRAWRLPPVGGGGLARGPRGGRRLRSRRARPGCHGPAGHHDGGKPGHLATWGFVTRHTGYLEGTAGTLNPSSFPVADAQYAVTTIRLSSEGVPDAAGDLEDPPYQFVIWVRGPVTSVAADSADSRSHVLPEGVDFTLRLDGTDWSKSYSLLNAANRIFENRPNLPVEVGDVFVELYSLKSDYPPLTAGETVTVRADPPAPAPARPRPT